MKFIHTGDIHYGMKPDADKPWGSERANAVTESLATIINAAKEKNVELLLIAGDLFHRQPLVRDLKEVNYLFSTIPSVHVVIIAGNHDYIRDNSAVLTFPWASNVSYLSSSTLGSVYFDDINTEIYGFSYNKTDITENLLSGVKVPDNGHINILLAHGGDPQHLPFDKTELSSAGFSYCALGHIHKPSLPTDGSVIYCGSPEPLDKTDSGEHGYYIGEINPISRQLTSLDFVTVSKTKYISLVISVTPETTNAELLMTITGEIAKRGEQNIYRFKIRGLRSPDIEFDLEAIKARGRIIEILDESEPKYDFTELFAEHPSDMIGFFIRKLHHENLSAVEKKALYYGVNALLHTTDERSAT